jgi:hypothetical protein
MEIRGTRNMFEENWRERERERERERCLQAPTLTNLLPCKHAYKI